MGIQERREREKLVRRDQILDAALKVFQKTGWSESTMDQVADEAELAKGTLYLYFKDKEEIYAALGARGLLNLAERFKEIKDTITPACVAMQKIGEEYHRHFMENAVFMASIHYSIHRLTQCECEGENEMSNLHEAGLKCLEPVAATIKKGIDLGEFRKDIDPMQIAIIFWSFSDGIMTHQLWDERLGHSLWKVDMHATVWAGFKLLMKSIATDKIIHLFDECNDEHK